MASTIRSRNRWIRMELVLTSLLIWLAISPGRPVRIWHEVRSTAPVHYLHARLVESTLERRIQDGDTHARLELATRRASNYRINRYISGDPVDALRPLLDIGDTAAWETLFWIHGTEQDALVEEAARVGVPDAQNVVMQHAGVLDSPADLFLYLYRMQDTGPGWRQRFNRHYYRLVLERASGNREADALLHLLQAVDSGSAETGKA